jgi:hypothetical protein
VSFPVNSLPPQGVALGFTSPCTGGEQHRVLVLSTPSQLTGRAEEQQERLQEDHWLRRFNLTSFDPATGATTMRGAGQKKWRGRAAILLITLHALVMNICKKEQHHKIQN